MKTSLTVTENDVVELKCLANGKPIPTVQWLKGKSYQLQAYYPIIKQGGHKPIS